MFFEEIPTDSLSGQGRICLMELDEDGVPAIIKPIIEEPWHLSYPFVFQWEEEWYLLLANTRNRSVDLYRCTCWPDQWRVEHVLLRNVGLTAPTLHYHAGYWWLFGATVDRCGDDLQHALHLYYANDLCSLQWAAHPLNPLGVSASVPAGRLLADEQGRLLRPAQQRPTLGDSSIVLNCIIELSPEAYREEPLYHLPPPSGQRLIRTFNCTATSIWIDGS